MSNEQLLVGLVVMSMFPMGLKYVCAQGEIFETVGNVMNEVAAKLPKKLREPFWQCPRCMVPWYGGIAAMFVMYPLLILKVMVLAWPVTNMAVASVVLHANPWIIQAIPLAITAVGIQHTLDQ